MIPSIGSDCASRREGRPPLSAEDPSVVPLGGLSPTTRLSRAGGHGSEAASRAAESTAVGWGRAAPRWALVVLSIWVALHLVWLLRALYPGPSSVSRRLPWNMFSTPRATTTEIRAEGRTAAGQSVEIPLHDYYRFARGATSQRGYATSRFLLLPGHREERRAFAQWLAAEMERGGQPLVEVVLTRHDRRILDGRARRWVIGRFPVTTGSGSG